MNVSLSAVIVEASPGSAPAESAFWGKLLGGTVVGAPTHYFVQAPGVPVFVVQVVDGHVPPSWPAVDGAGTQQMHVDLAVDDLPAADAVVLAAGGRRLAPPSVSGARVYASPAGHPFCLRSAS